MKEPAVKGYLGRFSPLRIEGPIYTCGDIHGRDDLLQSFIQWVGDDKRRGEKVTIVYLGDYVDRGPQSRQVLERLIRGPTRANEDWIAILGNHDRLFAEAWHDFDGKAAGTWVMNGGLATSESYGAQHFEGFPRLVPVSHIQFLETRPLAVDDGERLYVHAGVQPELRIAFQSEADLTWIREPFLSTQPRYIDRLIVHGHTVFEHGPSIKPWRIGLDTGAYATNKLTGARFDPGNPVPRLWQSGAGLLPTIETPWVTTEVVPPRR